ncbi:hypothetical protein ACOSP7_032392 [Xanthoceras sorbifolium]
MSLSSMKSWILCLCLVSLVVANQVQVGAIRSLVMDKAAGAVDPCKLSGGSAPGCIHFRKKALREQANEYDRGCSAIHRCRQG